MLEIKNIKYEYKKGPLVLKDISFEMDKGDCLCILGPNGTGKTTLLKIILGFFKPLAGSLYIDAQNLSEITPHKRAKLIAYVSQSSNIIFPYTVREVILMGRTSHLSIGASMTSADNSIVDEVMKGLCITHLQYKYFQNLSGGEKQMVMIARALSQQAKYIIMDEPTSSLDYSNQIKILNTIKQLSKAGYGIIMTSHFPNHAFTSCNKVLLMKDGYIMDFGSPEKVVSSKNLTKLYNADVGVAKAILDDELFTYASKVCVPII